MLSPKDVGELEVENEKWKMFVLLEQKKHGLLFKKGSEVIHQVQVHAG